MPAWHNPTRSTGSCMAQRSLDERADLMLGAKLSLVPVARASSPGSRRLSPRSSAVLTRLAHGVVGRGLAFAVAFRGLLFRRRTRLGRHGRGTLVLAPEPARDGLRDALGLPSDEAGRIMGLATRVQVTDTRRRASTRRASRLLPSFSHGSVLLAAAARAALGRGRSQRPGRLADVVALVDLDAVLLRRGQ